MEGFVVETHGKFARLRTEKGDIVVKVKGPPPEVGKLVRISDQPLLEKVYLAEKVLQLGDTAPPLAILEPVLRTIKKPRFDEDIVFLSQLVQVVQKRSGKQDKKFWDRLLRYYETGNDEIFGLWLFTVSSPYVFQSVPDGEAPIHIFADRKHRSFRIDFVKDSKPIVVEGNVWQNQIMLSFSQALAIEKLEELRTRLTKHFSLVRIIVGDGIDGLYA
ncbi:hypothetical protein [Pseudothermotoga sp.]|uniref:hypothetical protein n=1 Tax=Pseudothermotoga sp. TaxID=2033661 RepID=UPI0031F63A3A